MSANFTSNAVRRAHPWIVSRQFSLDADVLSSSGMSKVDEDNMRLQDWQCEEQNPANVIVTDSRQAQIPGDHALASFRAELLRKPLVKKSALRKTYSHHITAANAQDADVSGGIKLRAAVTVSIKAIHDVMLAKQRMATFLIATLPIQIEPLDLGKSCKTSSRKFPGREKRREIVHFHLLKVMDSGIEYHTKFIIAISTQFGLMVVEYSGLRAPLNIADRHWSLSSSLA